MKFYLTCLLAITDAVLAVLPRRPAVSHMYAQLLRVHCDATLLHSSLISIRLAAQLSGRKEQFASELQDDVVFWTAHALAYRMNSSGDEHWLLGRCLFHIACEGEMTLPRSWSDGWIAGKCDAESDAKAREDAGDYPEYH